MRSPERLRRYVDYKKTETAFRLWDLDANGKVLREKITRGLLRFVLAVHPLCCRRRPPAALAFLMYAHGGLFHPVGGNRALCKQAWHRVVPAIVSTPCSTSLDRD